MTKEETADKAPKKRIAKIRDSVLYTIATGPRTGEIRAATVTFVPEGSESAMMNVHCVWKDDFLDPRFEKSSRFPVFQTSAKYDPNGAPGTFRFGNEEPAKAAA